MRLRRWHASAAAGGAANASSAALSAAHVGSSAAGGLGSVSAAVAAAAAAGGDTAASLPPEELAAAAAAAAARCAVSARDVALCMDMVSGAAAPATSSSSAAAAAPDAAAAIEAAFSPALSAAASAASAGALAAASSAGSAGGKGAAAQRLRQRTFHMSDLASDDATLDAATAAALAPAARALAAAPFAAGKPPAHRSTPPRRGSFLFGTPAPAAAAPGRRRRCCACPTPREAAAGAGRRVTAFQARPFAVATLATLDGITCQLLMLVATLYVLFAEDIKVIFFHPRHDPAFRALAILHFGIFCSELLLRSAVEPGYAFRFYFWLDVGAALSLLPDFIAAPGIAYGRAGHAARVGARLGRIIRFLRVVQALRLLLLVQLRRRRARERARADAAAASAAAAALGLPDTAFQAVHARRGGLLLARDGAVIGTDADHGKAPIMPLLPGVGASFRGSGSAPPGGGGGGVGRFLSRLSRSGGSSAGAPRGSLQRTDDWSVESDRGSDSGSDAERAGGGDLEAPRGGGGGALAARARRASRSVAAAARRLGGRGSTMPAGLDRPSAVWERMSALMSRKLIVGLLVVIIVYPFLEVVHSDLSPDLFLHSLESWPYGSIEFNATLAAYSAFARPASEPKRVILFVGACAPPPAAAPGAALPALETLPPRSCGTAYAPLLPLAAADPLAALRANEVLRLSSRTANSVVWFNIKAERIAESQYAAALTIGVVVLLLAWAYSFARDAHRLLINVRVPTRAHSPACAAHTAPDLTRTLRARSPSARWCR